VRYGSICSGIETATLAFPEHWEAGWFSEIDPFCCALLKEKYPNVKNLGDITTAKNFPAVDLIVGGTPCQSFSVQGLGRGMDDPRGKLTQRFCEIIGDTRPSWVVWENVPNVLRIDGGRAFGSLLGGLAKLGYGFSWRVLDAQYFGVPQRRKRLFVVGHYRSWQRPASVLFDGTSNIQADNEAGEVCGPGQSSPESHREILFGWTGDETPKYGIEKVPTLRSQQGGEGVGFVGKGMCRKLTVTEWERLQGIPDGYTKIEGWSDSQRKHAIGNAFCVNVMRWIAMRISFVSSNGALLRGG